jgi:hypothetical protein
MNQTYSFSGVTGHTSGSAGTMFLDRRDFCDGPGGTMTGWSYGACVNVYAVPATHEGVVCPQDIDPCLTDPHLNATL